MKHKKGLIILITIAVVSVIFGSHSIYKKIHEGIHFAKEEAEVTETFSEERIMSLWKTCFSSLLA